MRQNLTPIEKLVGIKIIKLQREPPYQEDDPCWNRNPWGKFGEFCFCAIDYEMHWVWYPDDIILSKVTVEDIHDALVEITDGE